jgi:hypothetical protein
MSDWFRSVFGSEDDKNEARVAANFMESFRQGEKLADATWEKLIEEAEKRIGRGDKSGHMEATLLIFVAVRKLFSHCEKSVAKFNAAGNSPVNKMWELLAAVFSSNDPAKAIAEMKKIVSEWHDDD